MTEQSNGRLPVALVTGATSGIGRAVALDLARDGFEVIVHGRDAERGAATVKEIQEQGGQARFVAADLADADAVAALAEEAGEVEVLINNGGISWFGPSCRPGYGDLRSPVRQQCACRLPAGCCVGAGDGQAWSRQHRQRGQHGRSRWAFRRGCLRRDEGRPDGDDSGRGPRSSARRACG